MSPNQQHQSTDRTTGPIVYVDIIILQYSQQNKLSVTHVGGEPGWKQWQRVVYVVKVVRAEVLTAVSSDGQRVTLSRHWEEIHVREAR